MLKEYIENYIPYNDQEENDKKIMLNFIKIHSDVLTRKNEFGHFTASSWVLNKSHDKVLMIYHNIYKSWAWTGGHADGEDDLCSVARREVEEETGVSNLKLLNDGIFSLEVIPVIGHVKKGKYVSAHIHYNLTYLFEADESLSLSIKEDENSGVEWIDIKEVVSRSNEEQMKVIYKKLNDKLLSNNR